MKQVIVLLVCGYLIKAKGNIMHLNTRKKFILNSVNQDIKYLEQEFIDV